MADIRDKIVELQKVLNAKILGQADLVNKLLITLLADGNVLVEGAPGLAKTKAIKTLSSLIKADYNRIQFTPDLLPSDITGSDIYISQTGAFEFRQGPIFANLVLADEINRAPAKVQSALLEAMAERQVSVGGKRYQLPELFMVMATQNPIEHEGTYNLPEAQLDRFLMYVKIAQPDAAAEKAILRLVRDENSHVATESNFSVSVDEVLTARRQASELYMSDALEEYIVQLVMATRNIANYDSRLKDYISFGASPRATIALDRCSRINAWLKGKKFVTPEDVHDIAKDILRHRIILSFEAQAEGITTDDIIDTILQKVALP